MALESVNTNMGAMVALQSLETTQSQLATTQKQISTGYAVADASDDGAAFAIAQGIRSTVGGLTSSNQQLGNVTGLLNTTQSALTGVSNLLASFRDTLVQLSGTNVKTTDAANYQVTLKSDIQGITNFMNSATYNGKSLVHSTAATIFVAQDGSGGTYSIGAQSLVSLTTTLGTLTTASSATTALGVGGGLATLENQVGTSLNHIGANINYVNTQITYNNNKIDALNSGLGSLVDADLAKESASLQALQIRQQLGTQALSLANQAPQTLLSLFK